MAVGLMKEKWVHSSKNSPNRKQNSPLRAWLNKTKLKNEAAIKNAQGEYDDQMAAFKKQEFTNVYQDVTNPMAGLQTEFENTYEDLTVNQKEAEFKAREEKERQALEDYAQKAREEDEPTISEKIEEVMETERTRPDFTEVLEPEIAVKEMMTETTKVIKDEVKIQEGQGWRKRGALGTVVVDKGKVIQHNKPVTPKEPNYIQNEEQNKDTIWKKVKENTAVEQTALPTMTDDEISDKFDIPLSQQKFNKFKNRLATDEDYHQRIEARINDLINKLENKEIVLADLTKEDRKVIMDIMAENE